MKQSVQIILLDDDEVHQKIARRVFHTNGFFPLVFTESSKAILSLCSRPTDVVRTYILISSQFYGPAGSLDFLEAFDGLSQEIKSTSFIYVMSPLLEGDYMLEKEVLAKKYIRDYFARPRDYHKVMELLKV